MDGLTWDASQFVTNMPILWSTQQEDIEEEAGYSMPNFDSSVVLNQTQETQHKPAQTDDHHLYSVCDFVPHYFNTNMAHTQQQQQLINGGVSHNDVNQDDRNISMILSDHCRRNIWSFSYNGSAVSSGESQSNNASAAVASSGTRKNKDMQCHASEIDDTASQSTSSHPFVVNQCKIVESSGKNRDICHLNLLDETGSQSSSSHPCVVNEGKILESKPNCAKRSLRLISGNNNPPKPKKPRWDHKRQCSSNINFRQSNINEEPDPEAIAHMKEMIYRAAAFRPVNLGLEVVEKPRRKNMRISTDPQTVAARQRRERISERIRVLQKIVPGGSKMDTASMLDEAANYLKFLRSQVKALESLGDKVDSMNCTPFSFINPNHNVQQYYSPS